MRVYFLFAGENSMRVWREKILYVDDFTTNYKNKKKVLKIRFLEYGGGEESTEPKQVYSGS